jgi:5-methylcytosine-specific restriction endonuclease McrA
MVQKSLLTHGQRPDVIEKKEFIRKYKVNKGCQECGYNELPAALELDHIDRTKKNFKLSRGHHYSWDRLLNELENCIVLCAICHRKKTTEEKDYLETDYVEPEELQYDLFGS